MPKTNTYSVSAIYVSSLFLSMTRKTKIHGRIGYSSVYGEAGVKETINPHLEMWLIYGVREPIWSYVYDKRVKRLPGTKGICSIGGFTEPKIEPEIVFHFRSAPPVGGGLSDI